MTLQFQLKNTLFEVIVGDINTQDLDIVVKEAIAGRYKPGQVERDGGVIWVGGPVWGGGTRSENVVLERCYHQSMEVARGAGVRRIGFPSVGTGLGGFPIDRAVWIALNTSVRYLLEEHQDSFDLVRFILADAGEMEAYRDPFARVMRTMTRL